MLPAVKSEKGDIDSLRGPVCLGPDPLILTIESLRSLLSIAL